MDTELLKLRDALAGVRHVGGQIDEGLFLHNDGRIFYANPVAVRVVRAESEEALIGRRLLDFVEESDRHDVSRRMGQIFKAPMQTNPVSRYRLVDATGNRVTIEAQESSQVIESHPIGQTLFRVLDEKRDGLLMEKSVYLKKFLSALSEAAIIFDKNCCLVWCNDATLDHFKLNGPDIIGKACFEVFRHDKAICRACAMRQSLETRTSQHGLIENGNYILDITASPIHVEGSDEIESVVVLARDISTLRQTQEEKSELQKQLLQAQKLESIGQLAGGIAHDFNNLLTGISGNISLILMDLKSDDPMREILEEVSHVSDRAANLTRQLLAFSRRQIIEPKIVNINRILDDLGKMLERLIGENIRLKTRLSPEVWPVLIDAGHIEQAIVNLVVNARDAMPKGGQIVIDTANCRLDEDFCRRHTSARPGPYVKVTVRDTGHGMDADTRLKIFEPFFTTKPKEKGTGLGLATVYGVVRQHGGIIDVASAPGEGASFMLYFPRSEQENRKEQSGTNRTNWFGGDETILMVEDERVVRDLTEKILSRLGYNVLVAENGRAALDLLESRRDPIHLLMTDVVMPGMNGRDLAERVVMFRPEVKVLFTSGYTEDVIANHGMLHDDLNFISKPYDPGALATKIRDVLEN